jgi:hypothetical protein
MKQEYLSGMFGSLPRVNLMCRKISSLREIPAGAGADEALFRVVSSLSIMLASL